jgi:CRISPR-associated protein Cas5d
MSREKTVTVRVWGDFACFTRPEMKVERVSYPLPTPSAARGILEAIYWEPEMYYLIDAIHVVKKGRWFNFRRNEVTKVVSLSEVPKWMKGTKPIAYIEAGGGAPDAAQRNMLALAEVEYLITAEVHTSGRYNPARNDKGKYLREIRDRAAQGKCCHRPALGCREFAAEFDLVEDVGTTLRQRSQEVRGNPNWQQAWSEEDLGLMLYDVFDHDQRAEGFRWLKHEELTQRQRQRDDQVKHLPKREQKKVLKESLQEYEGIMIRPLAYFFHAQIKDSAMDCHPERIKVVRPQSQEIAPC